MNPAVAARIGPRDRDGWRAAVAVAVTLAVVVLWASLAWMAARETALLDATRFDIVRWEATTLPNKWLYQLGAPLRDDPPDEEALARYFGASREIEGILRASGEGPSPEQAAELDRLRDERRRMENHVEAIIEGRITAVVEAEGLTMGPSPFPRLVWPPVDFELTAAPRVLAESPRDRIELLRSDLLSNSLSREQAYALEGRTTNDRRVAIVLPTGGVAAYPSIVDDTAEYRDVVEAAAHEWLHQYLFFHPLGRHYFTSGLRDVNETVATLGGEGIAALVLARYSAPDVPAAPVPSSERQVDVREALGALRREVDALLGEGRVADAEARMEERRHELELQGVHIRKINQAYFAYRGLYATSGAAAGDLGPRLRALRELSGSVGAFIRAVQDVASRADLEALLASQ